MQFFPCSSRTKADFFVSQTIPVQHIVQDREHCHSSSAVFVELVLRGFFLHTVTGGLVTGSIPGCFGMFLDSRRRFIWGPTWADNCHRL